MSRNVSIAISAKDNYSTVVKTIQSSTKAFGKDLDGLQERLNNLDNTKHKLQLDTDKAKDALTAAKKAYKEFGDAASEANLKVASEDYATAKRNLDAVSKAVKQTEKDMQSLDSQGSKMTNKAGYGIASASSTAVLKLISGLGANVGTTLIGSAFDSEMGTLASSTLEGLISGASMSLLTGNPLFAIAGAGTGLINGTIKNFSAKDEAYKSYNQDLYNNILEEQSTGLTNGIATASQREMDQISFATLLGGAETAQETLLKIKYMANSTPFVYDDLTGIAKQLSVYGYGSNEIMSQLQGIGGAGAAIGWSTSDMETVAQQIGFLKESDAASALQLKQLQRKGLGVYDWLGEAYGKSTTEIKDMVSAGELSGEKAAEIISEKMLDKFGNAMEEMSQTYTGLSSTVSGLLVEAENGYGEGYNNARIPALQEQISFLNEDGYGNQLSELNSNIGAFQASLENAQEEIKRNIYESVFSGKDIGEFDDESRTQIKQLTADYNVAQLELKNDPQNEEALAEMARIKGEIEAMAYSEYMTSEGKNIEIQAQLDLIDGIQDTTGTAWENYGYTTGKAFTKGMAAALYEETGVVGTLIGGAPESMADDWGVQTFGKSNAYGLSYVPYNGYAATLHEGERVLTAAQNRQYSNGGSGVIISGNSFTVREEADIDRVAEALVRKIELASLSYVGG